MGPMGILQTLVFTVSVLGPTGDCTEGQRIGEGFFIILNPSGFFGVGWAQSKKENAGFNTSLLKGERVEKSQNPEIFPLPRLSESEISLPKTLS